MFHQFLKDRHRSAAIRIEFKATKRRLISQRLVGAAGFLKHHRVLLQMLMIIQTLIANREPKDTLAQHRFKLVHTAAWVTRILSSTGNRTGQGEVAVELAREHNISIGGDVAAFKSDFEMMAFAAW